MTIHWSRTRTGRRRHAVPTGPALDGRALCGVRPAAADGWTDAPALLPCLRCERSARPVPVVSTNVAQLWHVPATGDLFAMFHHGGTYRYLSVPRAVFWRVLEAASVGGALHQLVKRVYAYLPVDAAAAS